MRALTSILGLSMLMAVSGWGEKNGTQRLESAQQGIAEPSWPRKPEGRLSPLSGKMKETMKISPKFYGQEKEFPTRRLGEWHKESRLGQSGRWEGGSPGGWEEARWNQDRSWDQGGAKNQAFQTADALAAAREQKNREIDKASVPAWSSPSSRLGVRPDGTLRRYDGRLTRVREQVWREAENRDLGPGRREMFRPEDVEKMLSQPVGEFDPRATARSPSASPLAAADN